MSKRKVRQPEKSKPSSTAFRAASTRLDRIKQINGKRRRHITRDLPSQQMYAHQDTAPGDGRFTTFNRSRRRVVLDSEDENEDSDRIDDEEDYLLADSHLSTTKKDQESLNIERRAPKPAGQGGSMPISQPKGRRILRDEDLDSPSIIWDTLKEKNPRKTRQTRAETRQKVQSPPLGHAPALKAALPDTHNHKHCNNSSGQQSSTDEDDIYSRTLQTLRQPQGTLELNDQAQLKVKRSRAYNHIELRPMSQHYDKRADPTYDPIRDPSHPIHEGSDNPLRGVEDAFSRRERVRLRAKRRY
ncbi:hypothetical protein DE146DRAFT_769009 [Phaeosphaeria sp. MPI-PUGE-AT-0046c]|nr:hypothetical protein DE146DRAFT_769009 [Phaeosphaeria sp. MPI-PUGE-AT-0046c]